MADYLTPTTELEAVNECLRVIGESPLNSLDAGALAPDADTALRTLKGTSREVQAYGWHFNSERDYPLVRDVSGNITVPTNALRVDPSGDSADVDAVTRGSRMYDRKNHTYVFTQNLKVDIVLLLPFSELPEAARSYITIRAARKFQAGAVGSQTLAGFTDADEVQARALMLDAEGDTADYNILTDSYSMAAITMRGA